MTDTPFETTPNKINKAVDGPFFHSAPGQDSHERFALQAEAESLRQTVEKLAMQVAGKVGPFQLVAGRTGWPTGRLPSGS